MDKNISFTLKVWRQKGPKDKGHFDTFQMKDIPGDTSFLEMMDILNEQLINEGKEPIVFDHDCREAVSYTHLDVYKRQALLDAVAQWGKSKGMDTIQGPLGFTDFDAEGMLVEGCLLYTSRCV